ncbi:MAG: hypothetical protein FJ264_00690 [Planctomycetes bacterium]|nr:hypothetical protein [Planctomycetota bacterium]
MPDASIILKWVLENDENNRDNAVALLRGWVEQEHEFVLMKEYRGVAFLPQWIDYIVKTGNYNLPNTLFIHCNIRMQLSVIPELIGNPVFFRIPAFTGMTCLYP